MEVGQNVRLAEISDEFEIRSCQIKTMSLGQILEKPCVYSRGHIFSLIIMKLRIFVLIKSQTSLKMAHVGSKLGH